MWQKLRLVGVALLIGGAQLLAWSSITHETQVPVKLLAATASDRGARVDVKINRIRLEPSETSDGGPASMLRFDAINEGDARLTDLVLEVAIVRKAAAAADGPKLVAGPFKIEETGVFEPGYTIEYEVLLRNLSSECDCTATVDVRTVRPLPAADSRPDSRRGNGAAPQ